MPTPVTADQPTILVIVGITGDLARRKLLPAVEQIAQSGELKAPLEIWGITRRQISPNEIIDQAATQLGQDLPYVRDHFQVHSMDLDILSDYHHLKTLLNQRSQALGGGAQYLFYLSVPPQVSPPVVRLLGESGLAVEPGMKVLVEKPFGSDYDSAQELVTQIQQHLSEDQVYRIDHYLAKEMAQNLLVFRNGNSLFKNTWNRDFISKIEILASETIGIEGRAAFYEQTGALRDVVQSHLLQLAALTLMDLTNLDDLSQVPQQRLAALKALQAPDPDQLAKLTHRGQYLGYEREVNNLGSEVETFVSLTLFSTADRWEGVPITLTTGKALDSKTTEIRIHYRQSAASEANQLVLHIQPAEGIEFDLWSKKPGYTRQLQHVPLAFSYKDHFESLPEAYEQVLLDAIRSDHSLFTSSEEVLESWRILAPIQHAWSRNVLPLLKYQPGSTPADILKSQSSE